MKNRNNKKQARIGICILIAQLTATQSYAQTTPDPCAIYKYTKIQLEKEETALTKKEQELSVIKDKLNSAMNRGIYTVSIFASTSTVIWLGKRAFTKSFISELETGKVSGKIAIYDTVFSLAAGLTVASILVSGKDIITLSITVSDLKTEVQSTLEDKKELEKNLVTMILNSGCQ